MKIRSGFVSNSSSTSFCIVGLAGERADKKLGDDWREIFESFEESTATGSNEKGKTSLSFYCQEDHGFIGIDIDSMKEDETLGDFKKRAAIKLSTFFKKEIKKEDVDILVDGWYEG